MRQKTCLLKWCYCFCYCYFEVVLAAAALIAALIAASAVFVVKTGILSLSVLFFRKRRRTDKLSESLNSA